MRGNGMGKEIRVRGICCGHHLIVPLLTGTDNPRGSLRQDSASTNRIEVKRFFAGRDNRHKCIKFRRQPVQNGCYMFTVGSASESQSSLIRVCESSSQHRPVVLKLVH
ncbi:hypothetical protein HRI_000425600 [Hibiscus trionum]|uniref:Uncharacterized protein n=1 Tax=Hibiscus trionum TaxID=183268 RepID=A0A9W7LJY8_HIBTR|nr:hypothetical protein HRI_000425600 [Hibiscus trionum]